MKLLSVLAVILVISTSTSALPKSPCTSESCNPDECYRCPDGFCMLASFRCDGEMDCSDGSDEDDCARGYSHCGTQFRCLNNECINADWECNQVYDCDDSSDEEPINNCDRGKGQCHSGEYECDRGQRCYTAKDRCNGFNDCSDGKDEQGCDKPKCLDTQFTCTITRECIQEHERCNKVNDCEDYSDEINCQVDCRSDEFRCGEYPHSQCILQSLVCDGSFDCTDHSDEEDCDDSKDSKDSGDSKDIEVKVCGDNKTLCAKSESTTCILNHAWCDGNIDCPGGEDEQSCNCDTSKEVECLDKQCILTAKFCDGVKDCLDGSDEKPLCCRIGYQRNTPDSPICEDIDECQTRDGACSQYCHNTNGSFTCSCAKGYTLQERPKILRLDRNDKQTYCKASGPPLKLLVSIGKEIRVLEQKPRDFTVITIDERHEASDNTISDFDYDYREKKVFWCATHKGDRLMTMLSANFTGNSLLEPKIMLKNIDCGSIAVDWVNHLVYWTVYSADTMVIEVVKYDGTDRRSIIWEGLSKPRMVDVVPEEGLLFWTDWGDDPHIGRANMDGSGRKVLIQSSTGVNIRWPNALTVDLPTKHIYWMDASHKSIESMDFDGGNRYTLSTRSEDLGHPWRMRVFEDRLFWTDWSQEGRLSSLNKFNGNDLKYISTDLKNNGFLSLRTYHPLSQPMVPNRCAKAKCTHLCMLIPKGYRCGCPTGHKLLYDNITCESYIESYAFVAFEGRIVKMALIPMEPTPQPIRFGYSPESQFNSLDFHNGWLYFNNISTVDSVSVTIDRMRYDGSEAKVLIEKKARGGVAVDYVNDKLYWANEETVGVGELDGSIHTTIIQREGYDFRDILLAPCQGLMYLSVWGKGKGIFRAYTDGSHFKQIIWLNQTGNCNPSGLTYDKDSNSLFFTNDKSLYRVDLTRDTLQPTIIYNSSNSLVRRLYGAAIWGANIIWTEWWDRQGEHTQGSAIMYMGKLGVANGALAQPIRYNLTQMPNAIKVHPRKGADCTNPNPCIDHDCSHLCLQRPRSDASSRRYTCVCPTGYALKEGSDKECAEDIKQYLVFNAEKGIQTISLDTSFLTPMKEPYSLNNEVKSFDLDCGTNTVYLCYNNNMFTSRRLFDKKAPSSTTLPIHTLNCSGMAIEWVTKKLFLADRGNSPGDGRILVVDINKPSLMSHIVMKISTPHDIAVHPRRGMIYWIDGSYNIWSTNMDGSAELQTIVHSNSKSTSSETITQLNIDYNTGYIYWTEEQIISGTRTGFIKRVHIDKRTPETVVKSPNVRIFGVAIMKEDLYYTDSEGMLYKKSGNNPGKVILKTKRYPKNILYLKSSMSQYDMINPCEVNNGGCSDLCLIDRDGLSSLCSCPTGIQLKDRLNCDTPFNKTLLVANLTRINMLPIAGNRETIIDTVLTSQPKNLRSIDVDIKKNIIYWSEIPARPKESAIIWELDMSTRKTVQLINEDIIQPNSIAVDWNAENLYWLDAGDDGKGTLEILSLRNKKRAIIAQYKEGSNNRPNQIVVDPKEKYIFVSYSVHPQEIIVKMWLDGSNPFSIPKQISGADSKKTFILTDLAIDIQNKRLYWATSGQSNQIQTCNYDGEDFKTLRSEPGADSLIQAVGVLNGNVFLQKQIDTGMGVRYFREGENTDAGTFPLEQIQGMIVSINVLSTDVLDGYVDMSCKRKECENMICIPNHINVTCKCSTDDENCKKSFEKKTHITTDILPFHPTKNSCPPDQCNRKGTCYTVQNSTEFYCECEAGYENPRCSKGNNVWKVVVCIFGIGAFGLVMFGICRHMRQCCKSNDNIKFIEVDSSENMSVGDTQSRDPRQQELITNAETAFGLLVDTTAF